MSGLSAFGTTLTIATVPVANLTGIGGPNISADTIDVSVHGSANRYREFVGGMIDGGEVSLEGNLTTAAAGNIIMTALEAGTAQACVITIPGAPAKTWTFQGIVTAFSTDTPYADKQSFSASIKVTGRPVLA